MDATAVCERETMTGRLDKHAMYPLAAKAREDAAAQGHELGLFVYTERGSYTHAMARCKREGCGRQVHIADTGTVFGSALYRICG